MRLVSRNLPIINHLDLLIFRFGIELPSCSRSQCDESMSAMAGDEDVRKMKSYGSFEYTAGISKFHQFEVSKKGSRNQAS
ncbi:MAG: hypothetical protein ACI9FB_002092 [Candidatus Azotimanducaceae bacterium]|jgi:hypothetical protein